MRGVYPRNAFHLDLLAQARLRVSDPDIRKKMSEAQKRLGTIPPSRKGIKLTPEHIEKLSGSNAHNWHGGVTSENQKIRFSKEYREWRLKVFRRDGFGCVLCGFKTKSHGRKIKDIHADHIKSFSKYPNLRFSVSNGRTLCVPCHRATDNYGSKANKKS